MDQHEETASTDQEATRRELLKKLGSGAAYIAPATVFLLSSKDAAAY